MMIGNGISPCITHLGAGVFNPRLVSNLVCWLDPKVNSTITNNAGYAVQIADLSGNGNNAVQASGASQPQIVANGINGRQALYFDGSNDFMNLPSALYNIGQGAWTALMVYLPSSALRSERLYSSVVAGTTVHGIASNNTSALARQTAAGSAIAVRTKTLSTSIIAAVRNGSNITCYNNGADAVGSSASASDNTLTELKISHDAASTGIFGFMGSFLLFNKALSFEELNYIGKGIAADYSATWTNV